VERSDVARPVSGLADESVLIDFGAMSSVIYRFDVDGGDVIGDQPEDE
jgi:hypothetical protein